MRIVILILGIMLLVQVALHIIIALIEGPISFKTAGAQLDRDSVAFTVGLMALYVSRLGKEKS